ncbi:MAG: adenylosuccinate lyase [Candidatus Gracilibacteria bacterium]|nr:adenylosuccinate lyase [Candidatus Gracilibacteria bacterium]
MLNALSPLDGRYENKVADLRPYFSEAALMRYRVLVEVEYLIALAGVKEVKAVPKFTAGQEKFLKNLYLNFSEKDAERIKKIEETTNHDVKAVEYFLREKLDKNGLKKVSGMLHFGLTSQDINNTALALMLKEAVKNTYLPALTKLRNVLYAFAKKHKALPILAHTHGQAASPTTLGKEIYVFVTRLDRQITQLRKQEYLAKFGGATGNFHTHALAYPRVNWPQFAKSFVRKLGVTLNPVTTQIESYDAVAELCDNLRRIDTILLDLARDTWAYISLAYFMQQTKAGEVGSSTMPHKVNPIDFENAEGNLGLANALFAHFSEKLPISRLQRDLTDSTVTRNLGVALGYALLALDSLQKGIAKLKVNSVKIKEDLASHPEVLTEAIQTILRKHGVPDAYEKLKELSRGKKLQEKDLNAFIAKLTLPAAERKLLLSLTPEQYTGLAQKLVK